ncbi:MAG: glutathione S-transferase family protein [Rickettsiaceae bacterium]|nr:glutathione S-transferase family protein [Rickettsiaceae bacterium]
MQTLYHHPICPLSRQIRVLLKELNLEFSMVKEDYWRGRKEFLKINPAATLPVLSIPDEDMELIGNYPIIEYLVEVREDFLLMPKSHKDRTMVRRYLDWFNHKFYREVSKILIDEKLIRLLSHQGGPRTNFLKAAKANLAEHLKFLAKILDQGSSYLISEKISCADIAAASHISVIDYFGEINWDSWPAIRHWYAIIKSRPAFRPLLQDQIAGFTPPKQYSDLDF